MNVARTLGLVGPAVAVGIGYIDPGNWSTDIAAGRYGLRLLWAVILSGMLAFVLQYAVLQWTLGAECDLATAIMRRWPQYALAAVMVFEGSILVTDVAEFSGIVLGSRLLFHAPLSTCVGIGLFFVAALLAMDVRRQRLFSYVLCIIFSLIGMVLCFEMHALWKNPLGMAGGIDFPTISANTFPIVVGIVGATVMPHNLFLHSALISRSCVGKSPHERTMLGRFYARETAVVLGIAGALNCSILAIGAALPQGDGSLGQAHAFLGHIVGTQGAEVFTGAFLLSGVAASAAATIAGDAIITAFSALRFSRLTRRACTLLPAALLIAAGIKLDSILLDTQIMLGASLPFVIAPFTLLAWEQRCSGIHTTPIMPLLLVAAITLFFDAAAVLMQFFAPAM